MQPATAGQTEPVPEGKIGPKIELSSNVWDFGEKWYGEEASGDITIKNVGDMPLKIIQVRSSCGCTVAKPPVGTTWNGLTMQPGEAHTLTLSYNTKKVRDKVSQNVTISTNDPLNPNVIIQVKGGIKQLFAMTPADRVTFTNLERDTDQSRELMLTSNVDEPVNVKVKQITTGKPVPDSQAGLDNIPDPETPPFEVTLEPVEAGKKYKLIVKTAPPLNLGSNIATIELETDNERFPTLTIPVTAYVPPRVQTSPMRLYVPRKGTTAIQRYVRVRYQTDTPVKVTGIETTHESVKAELMPPRTNTAPNASVAMHEIRATLPPASEFPAEGAEIIIKTDDPSPEYAEFRVAVVLQPEPRKPAAVQRIQAQAAADPHAGHSHGPGDDHADEQPAPEDQTPEPDPQPAPDK